jgi:hypothetical protein
MTGDLSKFGPSLSQKYGVNLNMAQGGLPTVGKTEKVGGIEVDKLPEALKNLIQQRDQIAADEQTRKDNPLVPQTGFTRTEGSSRAEVGKLDDFKPQRDQTPSTSVQGTATDINKRNQELVTQILQQNPELLKTILESRKDEARVVGEESRKRDVIAEWGAITRAEIARDQALAQSLLATNVLAHTPNMGVIQALNQTAPSVVGAYKMGSPVLGK